MEVLDEDGVAREEFVGGSGEEVKTEETPRRKTKVRHVGIDTWSRQRQVLGRYVRNVWIGLSATSAGTDVRKLKLGILHGKYGDGKVKKLVWMLQEDLWRV